jgi:hypothetical protein
VKRKAQSAVDSGVNDEVDQRQPPEAWRDGQRNRQRQDGVTKDVNGERREPTLDALFAARDPVRLHDEIGDEMLEREEQQQAAESP